MNVRLLIGASALALLPFVAVAQDADLKPCDDCADAMTVVSWGGAYQISQQKAYSEPYAAATGTAFTWDESSNEAAAKLRAQFEAGNVTWDLVDVEGPDSQRLCDEGLAMEIDFDTVLAPGADGSTPTADFGDSLINECFIPQIVFSTTFGYRTDVAEWNGAVPDRRSAPSSTSRTSRASAPSRSGPRRTSSGRCSATASPRTTSTTCSRPPRASTRRSPSSSTIKDQTIWWSAGAETPQLLADKEIVIGSTYNGRLFSVIEEQKQPVAMLWDWQIFDFDGWIVPADLPEDRLDRVMNFL